ncbi:MAG TPA: crosslink repair DNA glycosylase YcaQ family protein [Actinomycetota bacterium]|nr:crosslink repair DNA glycosylase YcaQ family protein [Actinomycetota bacterium]
MREISLAELRRRLVSTEGYAPRFRRGRPADVVATVGRLACVQLDSISTVERSHRLALSSRVGSYPLGTVSRLLSTQRLFEYWAHEACLLPIDDYPWHRWRMREFQGHAWRTRILEEDPGLVERVLDEVRQRGPLASRDFDGVGTGRPGGGMWNWKPAKRALEALFATGDLAVAGRDGFQRIYALPEQVIPDELLGRPMPSRDQFVRWATVRGVTARGALTDKAVAEMWRLQQGVAGIRPHADALVADRVLERVAVEGGGPTVLIPAGSEPGEPAPPVLLSPFDNLLWDRALLLQAFGFRHIIEVYKREHERVYGYYVLPLLWRDRLAGRADLKYDRPAATLRLKVFHPEPGIRDSGALRAALERASLRLARCIGAATVEMPML